MAVIGNTCLTDKRQVLGRLASAPDADATGGSLYTSVCSAISSASSTSMPDTAPGFPISYGGAATGERGDGTIEQRQYRNLGRSAAYAPTWTTRANEFAIHAADVGAFIDGLCNAVL
jgi:hypothetical protein